MSLSHVEEDSLGKEILYALPMILPNYLQTLLSTEDEFLIDGFLIYIYPCSWCDSNS